MSKKCPKCEQEHDKSGIYCSRSCANSRSFSDESKKKKSEANKKFWNSLGDKEKEDKKRILSNYSPYDPEKYLESLMTQGWDFLGIQGKRLRVILEQKGKCNKCGLTEWLGEPITFEYEHKDGDNSNNNRQNVEALCPNCHSQTSTWRGRKNGNEQKRVGKYLNLLCSE